MGPLIHAHNLQPHRIVLDWFSLKRENNGVGCQLTAVECVARQDNSNRTDRGSHIDSKGLSSELRWLLNHSSKWTPNSDYFTMSTCCCFECTEQ